jgi:voltage-gated potassium channel
MFRLPRRFWVLIFLPSALVVIGTVGYHILEEDYSLFDGLYMTIITLSTIGYGETHPLSARGRLFTICLILSGVFTFAYSASEIIRSIVSGEMASYLERQKMQRALSHVHDHIIVCGYGRMGRLVCKEFARLQKPFVVIDVNEAQMREFQIPLGIALVGDATSDVMLKEAGIERAKSLVTVMASDADNLFTTMSARLLNPKLMIVARVEDIQNEEKLRRAGANRVVSPYHIGGTRVAHAVLKPTVVDFIELTTRTEHIELQLEEARIGNASTLAKRTLRESRLMADHHVIIVAIKKATGHMLFNPPPDTLLEIGDILVAMGSRAHLAIVGKLANQQETDQQN